MKVQILDNNENVVAEVDHVEQYSGKEEAVREAQDLLTKALAPSRERVIVNNLMLALKANNKFASGRAMLDMGELLQNEKSVIPADFLADCDADTRKLALAGMMLIIGSTLKEGK